MGTWIFKAIEDGFDRSKIAVFVRDYEQFDRARHAVEQAECEAEEWRLKKREMPV